MKKFFICFCLRLIWMMNDECLNQQIMKKHVWIQSADALWFNIFMLCSSVVISHHKYMEQKIAAEKKNCPDVVLKLSLIELEMFGARILTFKIDYSNHSGCFFFFFHCNARSCFLSLLFQFGCGVWIVLKHSFVNKREKKATTSSQRARQNKARMVYTWTLFDSIQFTRLYS